MAFEEARESSSVLSKKDPFHSPFPRLKAAKTNSVFGFHYYYPFFPRRPLAPGGETPYSLL